MVFSCPAEAWITFSDVAGKCFVVFQENLIDKTVDDLMKEVPHQFYFAEAYDASRKTFKEPPIKAQNMGRLGKASCDTLNTYKYTDTHLDSLLILVNTLTHTLIHSYIIHQSVEVIIAFCILLVDYIFSVFIRFFFFGRQAGFF